VCVRVFACLCVCVCVCVRVCVCVYSDKLAVNPFLHTNSTQWKGNIIPSHAHQIENIKLVIDKVDVNIFKISNLFNENLTILN